MATYVLTLLFLTAAGIAAAVSVTGWRRRHQAPGYGAMAVLGAGITQWAVVDAASMQFRDPGIVLALLGSAFIGVCAVVASWHCFSYTTIDRGWRLTRRHLTWLAIEPALCLLAVATNPWHHQFFAGAEPTGFDGAYVAIFGPLFWLHTTYCYVLLGIALTRVIRGWARGASRYRGYLIAVIISMPSAIFNAIGLSLHGKLIDLTVLGFAVSTPIMYVMMTRFSLPGLAPVAHERVFQKIGDAVVVVDAGGRVLNLNPAADRLLHSLLPEAPSSYVGATLRVLFGAETGIKLVLDADVDVDHTIQNVAGSGHDLEVRVSALQDRAGRSIGWALVARDITERSRQRRELERVNNQLREQLHTIELLRADLAEQAVRDHLTGLHNRRYLMNALAAAVQHASNAGTPLALALVDLDHFKRVNDEYGHAAGDAVLVELARTLSRALGDGEVVARHGGEEFVLLLPGATPAEAVARLDALRQTVRDNALIFGGATIVTTFSAGVTVYTGPESPATLLQAADDALYAAKQGGRDRVVLAAAALPAA
ncbi:diguanylate cyclase [Amorphoplanes digitatis]|uniref:Diguanylate cyclase (GGDEF)-like protein n=1 Tax=Actinoplanes digitatis TaxID=1868 RepID=A0A7W7HUA6_9ACTN|nr:diguanylate cyclase [Actinoplanes digitatis]MBB4760959.1 diguanylate cyclase (GGDEF)-like protein [Actinoplanes digitatis]BFE69258.1 histidine kinase N-terminal 7TM domain-containing protein [Actinoplanes digitatis]GID95268.1 GGDEF domain-containing protein [Actinoplanes digitatis]